MILWKFLGNKYPLFEKTPQNGSVPPSEHHGVWIENLAQSMSILPLRQKLAHRGRQNTMEGISIILLSFPIWITFYFSLSGMARTPKTMFNRSGESQPPCLTPDFRGKAFRFPLLSMMLVAGLP